MVRWLRIATIGVLLALASTSVATAEDAVRWAFEPGDTYRYRIQNRIAVTTTGGVQVESVDTDVRRFSVLSVDQAGTATVEVMLESYRSERTAKKESETTKSVVDSDAELPPPADALNEARWRYCRVGQTYTATIDARGQFLSVKTNDEHGSTWARLTALRQALKLPEMMRHDEKKAIEVAISQANSPKTWQSLWLRLPEGPVGVGKSYRDNATKPSLFDGTLFFDITATRKPDTANGHVVFEHKSAVRAEFPPQERVRIDLKDFTREGVVTFDRSGWVVEHTENQASRFDIEFEVEGKPKLEQSMSGSFDTLIQRIE